MVVIVIVGILSAVALPNFLSQTSKAQATECTQKIGNILSQVGAEHLASSTSAGVVLASEITTADTNSAICDFADAGLTAPLYGVTVDGKGDLAGKYSARACVNATTGKRVVNTAPAALGTGVPAAATC